MTVDGMHFSVQTITPAGADGLLSSNTLNRRIKNPHLEKMARDMSAGEWRFTGHPITIDSEGVLIDGQHRLLAVIRSGIAQRFLIIENLHPESRVVTDTNAVRSFNDWLVMEEYTNTALLSAMTLRQSVYERTGTPIARGRSTSTILELQQCLNENPALIGSAQFVNRREISELGYASNFGWLRYRTHTHYPRETDRFFRLLVGSDVPHNDCPTYVLYRFLMRAKGDKKNTLKPITHMVVIVKAWNAFLEGRRIKRLTYVSGEDVPEVLLVAPC
jgi:hypothetical protein